MIMRPITSIEKLELIANDIRQDIIKMLVEAGSGHSAGPLGLADVFTALYFNIMKHDPANPDWDGRDILVLSNGHCVPVRYATMANAGYFDRKELMTLRKLGSRLQGHPERTRLPGMETTSGPLGSGLSQAAGMALGLGMDKQYHRWVYVVTSDGELEEGNTWEAAMLIGKYKLTNLIAIVDRNNIQIDGPTETVMPLEDLRGKWEAFGWYVLEIDGNDVEAVIDACAMARAIVEKPVVIIAHTIPGKGVDYMEYDFRWHGNPPGTIEPPGSPPKADQAKIALKELRTLRGRIKSEAYDD
jgi:transketolase